MAVRFQSQACIRMKTQPALYINTAELLCVSKRERAVYLFRGLRRSVLMAFFHFKQAHRGGNDRIIPCSV